MQFTADDSDHVHELQRLLAVTADTYNSLVEQVTTEPTSSCHTGSRHVCKAPPVKLRFICSMHGGTNSPMYLIDFFCWTCDRRRQRAWRCQRMRRRECRRRICGWSGTTMPLRWLPTGTTSRTRVGVAKDPVTCASFTHINDNSITPDYSESSTWHLVRVCMCQEVDWMSIKSVPLVYRLHRGDSDRGIQPGGGGSRSKQGD